MPEGRISAALLGHFFEGFLRAPVWIEPDGFLDFFTTPIKAIVGAPKKGGQLIIFHLGGVIEGVIMTLGALDLFAKKGSGDAGRDLAVVVALVVKEP